MIEAGEVFSRPLYECGPFRQVVGLTLRPGGLDLTKMAAEICGLGRGDRVLDIGCGIGGTAAHLMHFNGVQAVGLDRSQPFLREASEHSSAVCWVGGDARSLPFLDAVFDAVFCECVLSTLNEPRSALREVARVLKEGGRVVLSDLYLRGPPVGVPRGGQKLCSSLSGVGRVEELHSEVEAAGFRVFFWQDCSTALKTFAVRLLLASSSVAEFCKMFNGHSFSVENRRMPSQLGYGLILAERLS